jgi:hypothetical protein
MARKKMPAAFAGEESPEEEALEHAELKRGPKRKAKRGKRESRRAKR